MAQHVADYDLAYNDDDDDFAFVVDGKKSPEVVHVVVGGANFLCWLILERAAT